MEKEENLTMLKSEHAEKCPYKAYQAKTYEEKETDIPVPECKCDGYHTWDELYDHRITLYIALCKSICEIEKWQSHMSGITGVYTTSVWRSKKHSDGELCFGTGTQYILGIRTKEGTQISYHIPIERWEETNFAETREMAPVWDGHTSDDVLNRLKRIFN
jgi:hypothetical protein